MGVGVLFSCPHAHFRLCQVTSSPGLSLHVGLSSSTRCRNSCRKSTCPATSSPPCSNRFDYHFHARSSLLFFVSAAVMIVHHCNDPYFWPVVGSCHRIALSCEDHVKQQSSTVSLLHTISPIFIRIASNPFTSACFIMGCGFSIQASLTS